MDILVCEPHLLTMTPNPPSRSKAELKNRESYAREPLKGYGCPPLHLDSGTEETDGLVAYSCHCDFVS